MRLKLFLLIVPFVLAGFFPGSELVANVHASQVTHEYKNNGYTIPSGLNDDEKYWYIKFQEGNMLVSGWQDITATILKKTPESQRQQQREFLADLGEKIGMEWCKHNDIRKVSTSMLKGWGSKIKAAAAKDELELKATLARIDHEINSLLN